MAKRADKKERQAAILALLRARSVRSQEQLRELLLQRGFDVTQSTLSRDLSELRVVKVRGPDGTTRYVVSTDAESEEPVLERLLPHLLVSVDGVDHMLVVRTVVGGAQAVAEAIDQEAWPELLGSLAGDDTILLVVRRPRDRQALARRLKEIAGL